MTIKHADYSRGVALIMIVFAIGRAAFAAPPRMTMNRVCGTVFRMQTMGIAKPIESAENDEIRLYRRSGDEFCCEERNLTATSKTLRAGAFSFKKVSDGEYWIVVNDDLHDVMAPIRVDHRFKGRCKDPCDNRLRVTEGTLEVSEGCILHLE